jgi:hypothetical protein
MNYNFYKSFNTSKKYYDNAFLNYFYNLSKRQKISMFIPIICLIGSFFSYATSTTSSATEASSFQNISSLLQIYNQPGLAVSFSAWTGILEVTKYAINYIVEAQLTSIDIIASTPLGGAGVFDNLTSGLTLFAAIACFYKLLLHFRDTERFDNVKSFTGFFSYVGILLLFIFSSHIVDYVISFNVKINTNNITKIASTIDKEINQMLVVDFEKLIQQDMNYESLIKKAGPIDAAIIELKKELAKTSFFLSNMMRYLYYSFFGLLMTAVLAVPTVIMTLMVKIILSIMILGSKLVFLLAFIPGFENTWKTYMLNLLNVILWVPIFNIIISFIIALMTAFLFTHPSGTGQIIWLSIISLILAVQSISLTTTAASTIISGAGAGVGGALGGLNSMSAPAVIGGAAVAVAGGAMAVATISKFSKE